MILLYHMSIIVRTFQALAGAYAYYANYREYMERINSALFEIAIGLGKK